MAYYVGTICTDIYHTLANGWLTNEATREMASRKLTENDFRLENGETFRGILPLQPENHQKSFYGKAHIIATDKAWYLLSYDTIVCSVSFDGEKHVFRRHWQGYSATTAKHVHSFRLYCGMRGISKKEWEVLPVV